MRRPAIFLACLVCLSQLSGCIAAALPIVAAGALGKTTLDRQRARAGLIGTQTETANAPAARVTVGGISAAGASEAGVRDAAARDAAARDAAAGQAPIYDLPGPTEDLQLADILANPPEGRRQTGAISRLGAPYAKFLAVSLERQALWAEGQLDRSAILVPRVSLTSPKAMACQGLPPAVIIDVDRGSSDKADPLPFKYSAPGLAAVLDTLREAEITIIWLSARPAAEALTIVQELKSDNLLREGDSDFVSLNRSADDRKQLRRWAAAEIYCILATLGDARGDFDELYDYLLDPDFAIALERNFENGWFLVNDRTDLATASGKGETAKPLSSFFALKPEVNSEDKTAKEADNIAAAPPRAKDHVKDQ